MILCLILMTLFSPPQVDKELHSCEHRDERTIGNTSVNCHRTRSNHQTRWTHLPRSYELYRMRTRPSSVFAKLQIATLARLLAAGFSVETDCFTDGITRLGEEAISLRTSSSSCCQQSVARPLSNWRTIFRWLDTWANTKPRAASNSVFIGRGYSETLATTANHVNNARNLLRGG